MPDEIVDKEAEKIWADLAAKDATNASDNADPPNSVETTDPQPQASTEAPEVKTTDAPADTADANKTTKTDGEEPPVTVDIWADAKPEHKAAYEAVAKERDDKVAHARRIGGTVAGYQRQVDSLKRELDEARKGKPSDTKTDDKGTSNAGGSILDDPDIKKATDEYPEVMRPLNKVLERLERRAANAERELGGISDEKRQAHLVEQSRIVVSAHPDYSQIAKSPEFTDWYRKAPTYIQEGVRRNAQKVVDGAEVSHIVKLYKLENGITTPNPAPRDPAPSDPKPSQSRRSHQLESALTPTPRNTAPKARDSGPPDDEEGAWRYWQERDRRKAQSQ